MRNKEKIKFNFKKMAVALAFILCNCFLVNAMAEPYSQVNTRTDNKAAANEIQREKSVKSLGNDEYEISLKVWGNERTTVTPVDIVMVMDTSKSMKNDLRNLKNAMNTFIDKINSNVKESRISVIKFSGPTDFNTKGKTENAQVISGFNTSIADKKAKINLTIADGGTNAQAAWIRVKEQIDISKKDKPNAKRYVLFFTDGLPTVINNQTAVLDTNRDYIRNTIIPATVNSYKNAVGIDVKSYAIGLLDNISTNQGRTLAREFLNKINNKGVYFIENGNANLNDIYEEVANNIIKESIIAENSILTDIVTDEFEIIIDENGNDSTSQVIDLSSNKNLDIKGIVDKESNSISWDLGEIGATGVLVKFKVKLRDDCFGTGDITIPTNKEAILDYIDPVSNKESKVEFNKPEVSIPFKTGSITVEKIVENSQGLVIPANDTFSVSIDGENLGALNVNLNANTSKKIDFYLKRENTDMSLNKDTSKGYINVGTYNVSELVPMNYELKGIYVLNSKTGVYEKKDQFTIDKNNNNIKILVKNKYVNDKYFYDKAEKPNELQLTA